MTPVRFRIFMTGVAVLAGAIQLRFIHASAARPRTLSPDGRFARAQAYWNVRGYWFVNPLHVHRADPARSASALHPPLNSLLLSVADVASATGITAQRVVLALVFVAATVVAGLTVRILAGERAAILAALLVATYPALWVNPATLGPETLVIAVTCLLLFGAARFARRPSAAGAAEIGAYLGLAILTRTDLVALVVLVGLPLALLARPQPLMTRVAYLGVMLVLAALVVAPWTARNLAIFSRVTLVSNDIGTVVAGANCPQSFNGPRAGFWAPDCARMGGIRADQSVNAEMTFDIGRHYANTHGPELSRVGLIRMGRAWNLYDPLAQAHQEAAVGRPVWVSELSLWYFYAMVPFSVLGAVALRRRRRLLFPFISLVVLSTLTALFAYGDARYRVEADVALAMLAGVGLDALWRRAARHQADRAAPAVPSAVEVETVTETGAGALA